MRDPGWYWCLYGEDWRPLYWSNKGRWQTLKYTFGGGIVPFDPDKIGPRIEEPKEGV
jgi:hypothetical protein